MLFTFNGNKPRKINYNGQQVRNVKYNGVTVWQYIDFLLTNSSRLNLPHTVNADYQIECTFNAVSYKNNGSILGNSFSGNYSSNHFHLTMYNNRWYVSVGNSESNFSSGSFTDKHTIIFNKDNGIWFDGVKVLNYTPTNWGHNLTLGWRDGTVYTSFKLYEYKITSNSTGQVIAHYIPTLIESTGKAGLYDVVSGNTLSWDNASVGND